MSILSATSDFLAAKRLTRLVVTDEITRPIREHPEVEKHENLAYLLNCPFCVSVYTSGFIALSSIVFPRASRVLRYGLALAEAQALFTEVQGQLAALVETDNYGPPL